MMNMMTGYQGKYLYGATRVWMCALTQNTPEEEDEDC
jgi:hypothetical protein